MAQQKSEDRVVPQGGRKSAPTRTSGRGKAIPVKEEGLQLQLSFATAENPPPSGAEGVASSDRPTKSTRKVPKAKSKPEQVAPARMEEVIARLSIALFKVVENGGAPGPDGQTVSDVQQRWGSICTKLASSLMDGSYRPGAIRRVWIPKPGGGERGLGIPNVVDRVVQEAVRAVLEPLYEPTFHPSSHGFRPNRSCHTAIAEAMGYVREGFTWVVDMDLEKFFDRVHHQRLLARLAQSVPDKRMLALIGHMLKAEVVMPEGVKVSTEEGVPQGGPLSPLLSNIVLTELDDELARRGHRFVRYADDCNVYVRSERAGLRVMEAISGFIARRLRLKVNASKSAVARPETRHFLGFRLQPSAGSDPEVLLSKRSEERLQEKIKELTPRNAGRSLGALIKQVNVYLQGWLGYFRICSPGIERSVQKADAHIRRRLRAAILAHWKTKRTIARRLIKMGVRRKTAWKYVYDGRKSLWALSHTPAVDRGLNNAFFAGQGLISLRQQLLDTWSISAPAQLTLRWDTARS